MKRVLPDRNPSLDYALWEKISRTKSSTKVLPEQRRWLTTIDRGSSQISDLWLADGRNQSKEDEIKVFDFVSLSNLFDLWFDEKKYNRENLQGKVNEFVEKFTGGSHYFEGELNTLLDINWIVLGRVIGSAIANIGSANGWWTTKGHDAYTTILFWSHLKRVQVGDTYDASRDAKHNDHYFQGISEEIWHQTSIWFHDHHSFDPDSELLRSTAHRASSPFWRENHRPHKTYPNPFALRHQQLVYALRRADIDPGELAQDHGKITLQLLGKALKELKNIKDPDRFAKFVITIHGMCAYHIVRTNQHQQKIGLHLFSNLAARKISRGVNGSNVPDISKHLKTHFSLAKVLSIMADKEHKIIDWYSVEKETVDEIVKDLT
jgi:hypothetical protein